MEEGVLVLGQVIALGAVVKTGALSALGGIAAYRYVSKVWAHVAAR